MKIHARFMAGLLLLAGLHASAQAQPEAPTLSVAGGKIAGVWEAGEAVFKNIPYAAPPVGNLRWRAPQAVVPWSGTRNAGAFGPPCMQLHAPDGREDCLTLNVWAPEFPSKAPKAVMVWIHGGGNVDGRAGTPMFDGSELAKHGVVVVSAQYRLNVFGFFAHPELSAESPYHASGNYGLLDQIAVLHWVRDNIAAFGGDPGNVTIFGQSAGAEDVDLLLVSPLTKGLFRHAIAESGPSRKVLPSLAEQEKQCTAVSAALKAPANNQLAFLRGVNAADVLNAAGIGSGICRPTNLDGYVLKDQPLKLYAEGKEAAVPLMIGNTLREGFVRMDYATLVDTIHTHYGPLASRALEIYGLDKGQLPPPDPVYGDAVVQYGSDSAHRCRVVLTGLQHAQTGQPFYQFQFNIDFPNQTNDSTHSDEVAFVFGKPALAFRKADTPANRHVSDQMKSYWTNFAKTGDPNGAGLPNWAKFDAKAMPYMAFTVQGAEGKEGLRRNQCALFLEAEKARPTWEHPERAVPFNRF